MESITYTIKAGAFVTPQKIIADGFLTVQNGLIHDMGEKSTGRPVFDLGKKLVFPGLINAHDHLLGNYFPRVGRGPYINWLPWDNDLKSSPVYTERSKIPPKEVYLLGAYRNLFSGATTVSDHIPHFVNEPFLDLLPIRAIREYSLAHESSDYDLKWGDGIEAEYRKAVRENHPFITHIEEGYDEESEGGIDKLLKLKALGEHTVLIHAIGLSDRDIQAVARKKANIVWCPNSNMFMFKRTGNVRKWLAHKINVSLGTDSPMSGGLHLLDELHFAKSTYKKLFKKDIDDRILVDMVTVNPARAFRIDGQVGSIGKGKTADLIALDGNIKKPHSSLVRSELEDISLVIYKGRPVYGDAEYADIFKALNIETSRFKLGKKQKLSVGDPLGLLSTIRKLVGFKKQLPFLPIE